MQRWFPWVLFMGVVGLGVTDAHSIRKRSPQYTIETRVIVDAHAFNSWKTKVDSTDAATKTAIQNYVKSAFHDLNSILSGLSTSGINMDARIVSIEFVTEQISTSSAGAADSSQTLQQFQQWLSSKSYSTVDHTMLFTGLDLTKNGSRANAGIANLDRMCNAEESLSAVEATPSGAVTITMAHELGHSMSSTHDDSSQTCNAGNYIMKAASQATQASNQNFRFSACSIGYFKAFLSSGKGSCLTQTTVVKQTATSLGKLYTPDQMCQMVMGKTSYLCRSLLGTEERPYSSICVALWCKDAVTTQCRSVRAVDGFVCGKGKRCFLGDCVVDTGPSPGNATDTCPLGDIPLPMTQLDNRTCSQAVAAVPGYCQSEAVQRSCCASCAASPTSGTSCPYGDRANFCSGLKSYQCYGNAEACCQTCKDFETNIQGCEYGDKSADCSTVVAAQCYTANATCCARCKQFEKPNLGADCIYGDKNPACAGINLQQCSVYGGICCETCNQA